MRARESPFSVLFPGEKSNRVEIGKTKRFHNTEELSEGLLVLF